MAADQLALAQLLTMAALLAATAQYAALIRRRVALRDLAELRVVEASGLQGLVRVFLADQA